MLRTYRECRYSYQLSRLFVLIKPFFMIALAAIVPLVTACSPLAFLDGVLASNKGFHSETDISYGNDVRQRLDVYKPVSESTGARPLVVFLYGGSWRGGEKSNYRFVGQALAGCGIVTVIPDYRVYPDVRFPDFIYDAASAVRWASDNAARLGADPDHMVLAGHSAGAHMAASLALDPHYLAAVGLMPSSVKSVVGIAGPYGFDPLAYRSTRPIFDSAHDIDDARPLALAERARGESWASTLPRFALLHGKKDDTVVPENSIALAEAIVKAGAAADLRLYDGIGHYRIVLSFFDVFKSWAPVRDDLVAASHGGAGVKCTG